MPNIKTPKPGMIASVIQGFNRTYSIVSSQRDRKGNVTAWRFECGCGDVRTYKVRRDNDAHAVAVAQVDRHRCPADHARIVHAIAKAA